MAEPYNKVNTIIELCEQLLGEPLETSNTLAFTDVLKLSYVENLIGAIRENAMQQLKHNAFEKGAQDANAAYEAGYQAGYGNAMIEKGGASD